MEWSSITIPEAFLEKGVTLEQWTDWRWQLSHAIRNEHSLAEFIDINQKTQQNIKAVITNEYKQGKDEMIITPHLLSLIDSTNPRDPITLQHLPHTNELRADRFIYENVWEKDEDFLDGGNRMLQQKYPDIIVIRITNICQSFCRFCFEKERTLRRNIPTLAGSEQFEKAIEVIKQKKHVRQILISGGDPSILPDEIFEQRLRSILKIPQIKTIRIGTRTLLHNPYRVTPGYARMLGNLQQEYSQDANKPMKRITIGTHFNHPNEISPATTVAIRRLQSEGIEVYNQTILLKNINDNTKTLAELFRKLLNENINLHYLFHAMPVPRTTHFRTSVRKGQELIQNLREMKEFRAQLPRYVIPHETGKQTAEIMSKTFFETKIRKDNQEYPAIRFKSDITHK